ncbi:MAG: imelysin family protein [Pseudomonadota bacterium]
MRMILTAIAFCTTQVAIADVQTVAPVVDQHVLPGYAALASETEDLAAAAAANCDPTDPTLRQSFHEAFDAWVRVSHLRFGPSEENDRAFGLAFWPDPRGATPKALGTLIREEDPVVDDPAGFDTISVAARGFYALEFLLYAPEFAEAGNATYRCRLIQAIIANIAANAAAIEADWQNGYADLMRVTGNDRYRTDTEAAKQLFTSLSTGLEFTSGMRLGRPLGSFDRPRPNRAEARRSERSLRNVVLSLEATRALAAQLSGNNDEIDQAFARAIEQADGIDDPSFAGVSDPQSRIRVEALKSDVDEIRMILALDLGPELGITAGFNSLDGD